MMDVSTSEGLGNGAYNLLVRNREKKWHSLFNTFENVSPDSEDVAITDLPMPANEVKAPNANANSTNLSVTLNSTNGDLSEGDFEAADESEDNNEDESSDAGSEEIAQFSDSDDDDEVENERLYPPGTKQILIYETDNDEDASDTNEESSEDLDSDGDDLDDFLNASRRIEIDNNENINDADESSEHEEDSPENKNTGQSRKKRTLSESELDNDETKPRVKKMNLQFRSVNLYFNAKESDFENDSE